MPRPEPPIFDPAPAAADQVVADLADPLRTLMGIADEHQTSLEALTLWMVRPDIALRLHALQSAAVARARLIALAYLPRTVPVLAEVINDYADQLKAPRRPGPVDAPVARERRRAADGARKAITLLTNLTRLAPPPPPPTPPPTPREPLSRVPSRATPDPAPRPSDTEPVPREPLASGPSGVGQPLPPATHPIHAGRSTDRGSERAVSASGPSIGTAPNADRPRRRLEPPIYPAPPPSGGVGTKVDRLGDKRLRPAAAVAGAG